MKKILVLAFSALVINATMAQEKTVEVGGAAMYPSVLS